MGMNFNNGVLWIICLPGIVIGTLSITFEPSKPPLTEAVDISCKLTDSSSTSVTWNIGILSSTTCGSGFCVPMPSSHSFSMSGNVFHLLDSSVTIDNCISYSCEDTNLATDITSKDLHVAYFEKNDITITEPGANTDGFISVTTGCVLSASDLTITWSKIENGIETDYTAYRPDPVDSSSRSTCSRTCHSEEDKKVTNGFTHTEYTLVHSVEVQYKVTVSHSSYTDPFTWTSAKYKLKGRWWWMTIIILILGAAVLLHVVGIIIGLILTKTGCCCRGFYSCDDSDSCECCQGCGKNKCVTCACCVSLTCGVCCNNAGLPFWVQVLWWSIIGTPVALGIYMVWIWCGRGNGNVDAKCEYPIPETQSANPRTGQKKQDTKNKSKVSAQSENEQHNQEKKRREQPQIPLLAQTTEIPISGREDSDCAVSREHVNLQDSDRTRPLRPIPDIPRKSDRQGHDSKGRGLSANFSEDDHPLVSIDIPLQKKGALDALPEGTGGEEPVKKKKKRKKKQEEDRE